MNNDAIRRTAAVEWSGDVAHGHGEISTGSGKIVASYSFGTRFSGDPGTNPEELLGAAHAACFTMATSGVLTRAGHPPSTLSTTATVHLDRKSDGSGFAITKIELAINGRVDGITAEQFADFAKTAEATCPVSNALRAVPIELTTSFK